MRQFEKAVVVFLLAAMPPVLLAQTHTGGGGQGSGGGVTSINSVAGPFTFSGSGVSCTSTTCTFSGSGSSAFNAITSGTNTTAAMVVGAGASLTAASTGYITATTDAKLAPTVTYYVDGNRTDSYTATGSIDLPFKTMDAAWAAMASAPTLSYNIEITPTPAASPYVATGDLTGPSGSLRIHANGATVNMGVHALYMNGPYSVDSFNVNGPMSLGSPTEKSYWRDGAITGTLYVGGVMQMSNTQITSSSIQIFTGSAPYFTGIYGTGQFVTQGATAQLFIANSNITYAGVGPAINASAGGQLYLADMYVANASGPVINCADGATLSAPNVFNVMLIGGTGTAPNCGSAATIWTKVSSGVVGTAQYGYPDLDTALTVQGNMTLTGALPSATTTALINYGTQSYSDSGMIESYQASTNGYIYNLIENTNAGATASANWQVGNANTTVSTYYGKFGMNGSGFSGTGAFNQPNNVYLDAVSADLAIGTTTGNNIHFVYNGGATDTATIDATGFLLPAIAAGAGHYCLQISTTGLISNTGAGCGGSGISGLTLGYIPLAGSATTLTANSHIDDGVTTTGVLTSTEQINAPLFVGTGSTPGALYVVAGTGSIPTLTANSAGFAAPATGGTAYLLKMPATIAAGILHAAAPATGDGVNESALTSSAVSLTADVTGLLPHTNIASTAVTPGAYTNANITVAADGTITLAANGSSGGTPCTTTNGSLQYDNSGAFGCTTPFTFAGSTITGASGAIVDMTAAAQLKVPVTTSYTAAANGEIGEDTNLNYHGYPGAADAFFAFLPTSGVTTGHCLEAVKTGNVWELADAGGTCTTGGGGGTVSAATVGEVAVYTGTTTVGGDANLRWITAQEFMGIGSTATQLAVGNFMMVSESAPLYPVQLVITNTSNGVAASGDFIVQRDDGTNLAGYGDFGCNSSGYSQAAENAGSAGDCYLLIDGNGTTGNGNFNIATDDPGTTISFNVGGTTTLQTLEKLSLAGGHVFQNPTPTIAPALTLSGAIAQTSLTFTAGSTLTTISGTAPNMTINGTFASGGSNAYLNWAFTISNATNPGNSGTFIITGSSTTTMTYTNAGGVAETLPTASAGPPAILAATLTSAVGTTYVGTITGGAANAYGTIPALTVAGFTNTNNNGTALVPFASSTTAIATTNASGVTEPHAATLISTNVVDSIPVTLAGTYSNSGTSSTDSWTLQDILGSVISNPTSTLLVSHTGTPGTAKVDINAGLMLPTLAAGSGNYCLQVDTSGNISNTGAACGSGGAGVSSLTNSDGTITVSSPTGAVTISAVPATVSQSGVLKTALTQNNVGTDASGNIIAAPAVDSAGFGALCGAGHPCAPPSVTPAIVGTANRVFVWQFVAPYTMTIAHASTYIYAAQAGGTGNYGIYTAAGNKLIDTGAISMTTSATVCAGSGCATSFATTGTIQQGQVYWVAWAANATTTLPSLYNYTDPTATVMNALSLVTPLCGYATNTLSAGALPAALGTITAGSNTTCLDPFVKWEY